MRILENGLYYLIFLELFVMMLIVSTGIVAKKLTLLNHDTEVELSQLTINIFAPAYILVNLTYSSNEFLVKDIFIVILLTSAVILIAYITSFLTFPLGNFSRDIKGIYQILVMFGNCTYLGFPICLKIFGSEGLFYAVLYSIVQDMLFWSLGLILLSSSAERKVNLKAMINPCFIAIIVAMFLKYFKINFPYPLNKSLLVIGDATVPIALILIGSGVTSSLQQSKSRLKNIALPVVVKLFVVPLIVGSILYWLKINLVVKMVVLLLTSMPVSATSVVIAKNYGHDDSYVPEVVLSSTFLSAFSVPIILYLINA